MDKKIRKRLEVLRDKLRLRKQQLASAKQQCDEPDEADQLVREVMALEEEVRQLQQTGG